MSIASNYTTFSGTGADQAVASGESLIVYGINIYGVSASTVVLEEYGTSTVIKTVACPANDSNGCSIAFRADKGVQVTITGASTTRVTIFHSNAGV